ncbi:MAG: thiamine pyrophosphate-binding protein [Phycisphaerales bacterium]|nr:thiamine pyrophosphate-binding protein [Phycisphaerales bacterium]
MARMLSDQVLETLKSVGVRRIFGIPGDTIDTLMESLRTEPEVEFVVCRHEANAAFMASGDARVSGGLGVAVACQGPGTNNLINGLADAAGDRIPVLCLTGQVDSDRIGSGMPQESSQIKLLDEITVFNAEARTPNNLMELLHIAINAALTKRGVAHISVPSNVMLQNAVHYPLPVPVTDHDSELVPSDEIIKGAVDAINAAKRPVILYGSGSRSAAQQIVSLSEKLQAPLLHTTRSKDIIDNNHGNVLGGIGIMGNHPANHAMHEADLLLIVGCNFAWRQFYPSGVPIVKIDIDPEHLATHIPVTHPILASARPAVQALLDSVDDRTDDAFLKKSRKPLVKLIDDWTFKAKATKPGKPVHPAAIMDAIAQTMDDDAIVCGDSGSTTIWFNNVVRITPKQRFIWSANLATLGGGMPQAIGASFAAPDRQVIMIGGDGGFQMSIQDLVTAAMYERPIKCFILNNGCYKFIEFEEASHDGNVASGTRFLNPDYAALAEACHCKGISVSEYDQLLPAVQEALAHDGPCVVDCNTDPDALMIPPAVTKHMALNYVKSEIKSWFSPPSPEILHLAAQAEAEMQRKHDEAAG